MMEVSNSLYALFFNHTSFQVWDLAAKLGLGHLAICSIFVNTPDKLSNIPSRMKRGFQTNYNVD